MKCKQLIGIFFSLFLLAISATALTTTADVISTLDTNINSTTIQYLTTTSDELITINNITPKTQFIVLLNQTGGSWDLSGSTPRFYLLLKGNLTTGQINSTRLKAYNASTLLSSGNYTVENLADGIVHINFTSNKYMNDSITFVYNRTFLTTEKISGSSICYPSTNCLANITSSSDYGVSASFILVNSTTSTSNTLMSTKLLDNRNYTITYTTTTRTITSDAAISCGGTKMTIFAGFALLAVAMIVLAAFGIVSIFNGSSGMGSFSAIGIGIMGLAIVIMIGYYIISTVGAAVCGG